MTTEQSIFLSIVQASVLASAINKSKDDKIQSIDIISPMDFIEHCINNIPPGVTAAAAARQWVTHYLENAANRPTKYEPPQWLIRG